MMDELLREAVKSSEYWQEELVDKVVAYRTSDGAKRIRLTPAAAPDRLGKGAPGSGRPGSFANTKGGGNPNRVQVGTAPNKPGTKRQFCRAYQRGQCSETKCPNLCTATQKARLHLCETCFKHHDLPRGDQCQQA